MDIIDTARTLARPACDARSRGPAQNAYASLVSGLEREFGRGAGEALAQRFIAAEETDFLWEARRCERWLGSFGGEGEMEHGENGWDDGWDDAGTQVGARLERIAVLGKLGRRWFAATLIVDGEGCAHGLLARRDFSRSDRARRAWERAR